jgi:hypothetical protein
MTADSRVRAAAPRVYGYGLVSQAYHSAGAEILGVVPGQEQLISALHTRLVQGSYLSEQTRKGVVIGDKLANTLTALFVWMSRFVAAIFPLTLSLSHKGRGNPRTTSSHKCKPL